MPLSVPSSPSLPKSVMPSQLTFIEHLPCAMHTVCSVSFYIHALTHLVFITTLRNKHHYPPLQMRKLRPGEDK